MNSDVTIVIPIFNLKDKRLRNFLFLFENYISKLNIPIIIAEQVNDMEYSAMSKYLHSFGCIYLPVWSDKDIFHKSRVLNQAAALVNTKYLWMIDADVFLKYKDILNLLNDQNVIQPHEHVYLLNEDQTLQFIQNKKFVVEKGTRFSTIHKFGPLSFIIKTDLYKQNLMDEKFMGWGWEDLDFAYRLSLHYSVENFHINGLHLNHEISPLNTDQERINRRIFFKKRKELTYENLKLDKTPHVVSIDNSLNVSYGNSFPKIIHIIAPALVPSKKELYHREILALESVIKEKKHYPSVITILACDSDECDKYKNDFIIWFPKRSSRDLGDIRGLPYLCDLFQRAGEYGEQNDIIFYTNSDCCLAPGTYSRLGNAKTLAMEYHRRDVLNDPHAVTDVFTFPNQLKETGIDGLALRKYFLNNYSYFISDFFIGEPHWDTAICGALRSFNISDQNTNDLLHPYHEQAWNPYCLTDAGKHNEKLYRDFLEYGISKIEILSCPKVKIETSIILVFYGNQNLRIQAAKRGIDKLQYQNILNVEFILVEVVPNNRTSFPEIINRSNWVHILLNEKDVNKDIFQKEAMMNIAAKRAQGDIIIFMDADIWTDQIDWLDQISSKIKENPSKLVHGFSFCQDSKNPDISFISLGMNTLASIESSLHENPGLITGMSKQVLVQNDYINMYSVMGGGDSILMHEYVSPKYKHCEAWWQASFPRLKNTLREMPICCDLDYVNCAIIHENHGEVDFGYYGARHYATEYFTKEIKDLLKVGENGLLEWIDLNCLERKIIQARFEMKTEKEARKICEEIIRNH